MNQIKILINLLFGVFSVKCVLECILLERIHLVPIWIVTTTRKLQESGILGRFCHTVALKRLSLFAFVCLSHSNIQNLVAVTWILRKAFNSQ